MSGIGKTIDREGDLLDDNFIDNLDINSDSKTILPQNKHQDVTTKTSLTTGKS